MVRQLVSTILKWFGQCGILFIFAVSCYHTLTANRKYKGSLLYIYPSQIDYSDPEMIYNVNQEWKTNKLIITHTCATSPLLETSWKNIPPKNHSFQFKINIGLSIIGVLSVFDLHQ